MPAAAPLSLKTYDWGQCYATSDLRADGHPVDILKDFYIPVLARATGYDRVAGYFTSSSLAAASQGFSRFVGRRLLETYPRNHLLCDEVGLGKTIEAGLAFRALWLSGRVKLMPAAGAVQFSEDLCELFYRIRERLLQGDLLAEYEAQWLGRYLHEVRNTAPEQWGFVEEHVLSLFGQIGLQEFVDNGQSPLGGWGELQPSLSLLAPLGRSMLRHSRSLLRAYQQEGRQYHAPDRHRESHLRRPRRV